MIHKDWNGLPYIILIKNSGIQDLKLEEIIIYKQLFPSSQ